MQSRKMLGASLSFVILATLILVPWSASAQPPCQEGCQCVTEAKAKEMFGEGNYQRCQTAPCGNDPYGKPMYCFSPAVKCPPQCRCLTEAKAKEMGYDKLCQNQRIECGKDARGYPKFCYQIPVYKCPDGCNCLSKEEALAQGIRDNCLDAMGNPIICAVIDAERGLFKYCFKRPVQVKCQFDYVQEKCVGTCPTGKKCQLNTIYRDPNTGKVTRAECHCK